MSPYATLGVQPDAQPVEIRLAWKRLCAKLHPDRNPDPAAAEQLAEINRAFDVVGDPQRRAHYDATGEAKQRDPQTQVTNELMAAIAAGLDRFDPRSGRTVIATVRGLLSEKISGVEEQRRNAVGTIENLRRVRSKIASTDESNAFHAVIDQRIDIQERNIDGMDARIRIVREAEAMLGGYSEEQWEEAMQVYAIQCTGQGRYRFELP